MPEYWFNPADKHSSFTLSGANRIATCAGGDWYSARCFPAIDASNDAVYFEFVYTTCVAHSMFGVAAAGASLATHIGVSPDGYGYNAVGGNKFTNNSGTAFGNSLVGGDVIGIAIKNGKIWFARNNVWQGAGNPATEANPAFSNLAGKTVYPAISCYSGGSVITANALSSELIYPPPSGFSALASEATVVDMTLSQPFSLLANIVGITLSQPFALWREIGQTLAQPFALRLGRTFSQSFGQAKQIGMTLHQYFGAAKLVGRTLSQKFGPAKQIGMRLSQPFIVRAGVGLTLGQPFSVLRERLDATLSQPFVLNALAKVGATLSQPFVLVDNSPIHQQFAIVVTAGGTAISPDEISIAADHGGYAIKARLRLPDVEDYARCRIGDVLYVNDGTPWFAKITEKSEQDELGNNNYTVTAESKASDLFDELLDEEFGPGVVADLAVALAARYGVTLDWQSVPGWPFPTGTLQANGQSAGEILRSVAGAVRAVLQSDPDNTLRIEPEYRVPTSEWATCPVDFEINDSEHIFIYDDAPDLREGYNAFLVSGQGSAGLGYRLEEEQISGSKKELRCYIVPWHDRPMVLKHSGGEWVTIEKMGVVTEQVPDELVEIVAGIGNCRLPIYQLTGLRYRERYLGAVKFDESGQIETADKLESLIEISYRTKYHRWIATNQTEESVQFYVEEE